MNERLLREWIRECLLLEQEQEEPESLAPNALEGVDWDEISKGTLFGQMEKLAALSQDRYSSPFFPPSAQGGSFSISSSLSKDLFLLSKTLCDGDRIF